jgi:hypothetical protein
VEARSFRSVVLLFGLLAFSGEVVDAAGDLSGWSSGWRWLAGMTLDGLLIASLWKLRVGAAPTAHWVIVGLLFIGLDVARLLGEDQLGSVGRIVALLLYLPLLTALFLLSRGRRLVPPDWEAALPIAPLIAASGLTWGAGVLWNDEIDKSAGVGVSVEFFAQASQVIPVLLLALLFQARVLRPSTRADGVGHALSVYVTLALVVSEVVVLSALTVSNVGNEGNGLELSGWHEYIAFEMAIYAISVALATLAVLVTVGADEEPEPIDVRVIGYRPEDPKPLTPRSSGEGGSSSTT